MKPDLAKLGAIAASLVVTVATSAHPARADVSSPLPGITLVRHASSAMTISNLCAPGVSVRATKFAERQATPQVWAQSVGAQVAINADFFDFPGWSYVLVRARGGGEEWPAGAEKLEQPSSYWQFGHGFAGLEPNSVVPPAPWVTEVVGAYDPLIEGGHVHNFTPDETFMLASYRRSAIGLSADRGTLYFYASAAAINGPNMAAEMIGMAAEAGAPPIDVATNQDGGGSSQLYVQGLGQVVDSGRQVNTHLGVYATGQGAPTNCPTTRARHADGSVATWGPNRLDLFIQANDDTLQHQAWDAVGGWSAWQPLGATVGSQPSVASWGEGRLDTFAVADDKALHHTYWDGAAFASEKLGGHLASPPVVTSWGRDRLDVFALADDTSLAHWAWGGAGWSQDSLGGSLAAPPAVTSWSANRLDFVALATDGTLKHDVWDGASFGTWESLGGPVASPPALVSWGPYRLDAFALAPDASLHHWSWGGAWAEDNLGGALASPPAVASWAENRLDVFGVGPDHALRHKVWNGAWSDWESLGGSLATSSAPRVVAWAPNRLDIFAEGTDHALWHQLWDGTAWGSWESRGGALKSSATPGGGGSTGGGAGGANEDSPSGGVDASFDGEGASSGCAIGRVRLRGGSHAELALFALGLVWLRKRRHDATA